MARGFVDLTAVVEVASRLVLAHKVAIKLAACHATEIIAQAFARYGVPVIVNTAQGSQFSAEEFTQAVLAAAASSPWTGAAHGGTRCSSNAWRSVKYACVYLKASDGGSAARGAIAASWTGSTPTGRIRGAMASRPNRPLWPWRQPLRSRIA
jgi:putative transposase